MAEELKSNFPDIFPGYSVEPPTVLLAGTRYTPNDWKRPSAWYVYPWAQDVIRVREAWDLPYPGAKGSASTIIGVNDTYFDLDNPDLSTQIAYIDDNTLHPADTPYKSHGTVVAGQAAAATDNGVGYSGVGFNCKLRISTDRSDAGVFNMTTNPYRPKVVNLSWRYPDNGFGTYNLNQYADARVLYNEIYERGVVTCVAAGNGQSYVGTSWTGPPRPYYVYPASFENVISTTNVTAENCDWIFESGGTNLYCKEHDMNHGDTSIAPGHSGHNHNPMVDICAPAFRVGGLSYVEDSPATSWYRYYCYTCGWGTSFASPQTAGVIGLMASVKECLSPYQLECALKNGADASMYAVPENAYLASPPRLGAGLLNAENAVINAKLLNCNDPATQTFYIAGVDINTFCAPGFSSNGVKPVLTPVLKNGTPPYTYHWAPIDGNTAALSSYTAASPTVTTSTGIAPFASYFLTVKDNSPKQKVAGKLIQFHLTKENAYDLVSRDAYMDMATEPNGMEFQNARDWNYWESPDVWNRISYDAGTEPQNVEYFTSGAPNYFNVRVRNMGCAAYPVEDEAFVEGFWTLASTGEHWYSDWMTADAPAAGGGTVPAGRMITTGASAIPIPNLDPGDSYIGTRAWNPVNPLSYAGSPSSVAICFLARIYQPHIGGGFAFPEEPNTTTNVKNNNNIATHNMQAVNLGRKSAPHVYTRDLRTTRVAVSYIDTKQATGITRIRMLTDKDIHLHFAGNPSEYMYVDLKLEDGLWTAWANGGFQGSYATIDANNKTVTYDPATPLLLENITLDTGESYNVDLTFRLRDDVPINTPIVEKMFYFQQLDDSTDEVLGSVSFRLDVEQDDTVTRKGVLAVTELSEGPSSGCQYAELMVANCGTNMADQVDVRGWIINDNSGILTGECDDYNVNRGHFRLAYDDIWARVPVGSVIVLYNHANNCYNMPDTLTYDTTNGKYWIPVGGTGNLHLEQYDAVGNSSICTYCADEGETTYTGESTDWMSIAGLDAAYDVIQVLCPGCTTEIPGEPAFYFGAGHSTDIYYPGWEPPAMGETNIGLMLASNTSSNYGFKYTFTGNTEQELLDPARWAVSAADQAGTAPPASLGSVTAAFKTAIVNHELNFPCCASPEEEPEEKTSRGIRRHTQNNVKEESIKVYPNPASNLVHFEFPLSGSAEIRMMDVTGRVMETQSLHRVSKATFDVNGYAPGLYMYEVTANGKKQVGKITVTK